MHPTAETSYRNQTAAAAALGNLGRTATQAIDKPRLSQQLDQLSKVLSECHSIMTNVENAADRIIGPTPQDATAGQPVPPSDTIERRLAEAIGIAEALCSRLGHTSQRLNTAV